MPFSTATTVPQCSFHSSRVARIAVWLTIKICRHLASRWRAIQPLRHPGIFDRRSDWDIEGARKWKCVHGPQPRHKLSPALRLFRGTSPDTINLGLQVLITEH